MATHKERQFWKEFFDLYKSKPELWKLKSEDYKNRAKKHQAYNVLIEKCKEIDPNANRDYVAKKINCFRTVYRRELRRLKKRLKSSEGENDEYVPSLWYYNYLSFLKDQEDEYIGMDSENEDNETKNHKESEPKPKKKKSNSSTDELVRLATQRLKAPQSSFHQISTVWGNKLSKMERNQRIIAEKVINEVMFSGELGLLNFNTTLTNLSSVCNLNLSSSLIGKTITNSNESSIQSRTTNKHIHNATNQQRLSTDHLPYPSPSLLISAEVITDHGNEQTEENFIVAEYDPLDNLIKTED